MISGFYVFSKDGSIIIRKNYFNKHNDIVINKFIDQLEEHSVKNQKRQNVNFQGENKERIVGFDEGNVVYLEVSDLVLACVVQREVNNLILA